MCIAFLAWHCRDDLPLILATNRDEYYDRSTAPMDFWSDQPDVLAGRDLEAGGTWMAINRNGRLAFLTNYRDPNNIMEDAPSRGSLVADYVAGKMTVEEYCRILERMGPHYNGFNLVFGTPYKLVCYSNVDKRVRELRHGIHGLSNHLLDTPWPKVSRGKKKMATLLTHETIESKNLFAILADSEPASDEHLPRTGISLDVERLLSPIFIKSSSYGSRCGTTVLLHADGHMEIEERSYSSGPDQYETKRFSIHLQSKR